MFFSKMLINPFWIFLVHGNRKCTLRLPNKIEGFPRSILAVRPFTAGNAGNLL